MNVLYLARIDYGGVGYGYYRAVNSAFRGQHEARHFVLQPHRLGYPYQHCYVNGAKLRSMVKWADVIHTFEDGLWRFGKFINGKRPIFVTQNGTFYRKLTYVANRKAREWQAHQLCTTLDLSKDGARWVPAAVKDMGFRCDQSSPRISIAHAPTNRKHKGTDVIIKTIGELDAYCDVIEDVGRVECLARKAMCQIYVDQMYLGYGLNAVECWYMGMPVLSNSTNEWYMDRLGQIWGQIPFVITPPDQLRHNLAWMLDDRAARLEAAQIGEEFARHWHAPDKVAGQLVELYEERL